METFLIAYWIIYGIGALFCIIGGFANNGDVGSGIAIALALGFFALMLRSAIVDTFATPEPWTITEITHDVRFIDYAHTLGIEQKLIPTKNSLVYDGLKNPKVKFYKNFQPANKLSWTDSAVTHYKAFLGEELVFEHLEYSRQ